MIPTSISMVEAAKIYVQKELSCRGVDASHDWTCVLQVAHLLRSMLNVPTPTESQRASGISAGTFSEL